MTLAISDPDVTTIDIPKIQAADVSAFQQLYQRFYDTLVAEAMLLLNDRDQAIAIMQLGCIHCWMRCENISSEEYYLAYVRGVMLRFREALNDENSGGQHRLRILKEIVSDQYALSLDDVTRQCERLTLSQMRLLRQIFKSYYQPGPSHPLSGEAGPYSLYEQTLLNVAFYMLHYIFA